LREALSSASTATVGFGAVEVTGVAADVVECLDGVVVGGDVDGGVGLLELVDI
jgi:hypothetical protein